MRIYKTKNSELLDEYSIKDLKSLKSVWAVYYYRRGNYEGNGFLVWFVDGKYHTHDMGHCSCYGPIDHIETDKSLEYSSIEDLEKAVTAYGGEAKEVFAFIKSKESL